MRRKRRGEGFVRRVGERMRLPVKGLLEESEDELHSYVRGPLFPRRVVLGVICAFSLAAFLTFDWFGLLLINSDGVVRQIGILGALRVTASLLAAICATSVFLMFHYRRLHTYESEENVFFAITFSLSFMTGFPCALVGLFG